MSDADAQQLVGENVRRLRQIKGWTQEELALSADMARTYVGEVERGGRNLSIGSLFSLAKALEVDPRKLLCPIDEFEFP